MTNNKFPQNLLYNKDYSWVKIDGDIATLGVIEPATSKVKEFVFIKLPEEGQKVKKGEDYVSLEAIKWSGHLSSPVSGEVVEVNSSLFDEPGIINQDPYKKGWIVKVKMTNKEEKKELLKPKEVEEWLKNN
ncbi:MAG: glycine cleavage system protein H [Minisyncoccales bacterium]